MSTPYTYLITHLPTGKKYYGVRYAKNCHPTDLGIKYFSSSKAIIALIRTEGQQNFSFQVRKVFQTKEDAAKWELKVLRRLKVHLRSDWFNLAPNYTFSMYNPEIVKKVVQSNLKRDPDHFKKIGALGAKSRIKQGKHLIRYAAKTYKVTWISGIEEIVADLKMFALTHNARYDTLRGCVSSKKPYKSKNILKVEILENS